MKDLLSNHFDITKYKWSNGQTKIYGIDESEIILYNPPTSLNKDDAIAIAKHFDLISQNYGSQRKSLLNLTSEESKKYTVNCVSQSISLGLCSFGSHESAKGRLRE